MPSADSHDRARQLRDWLQAAHAGSLSSLGKLLESCRNYLLLIANQSLDQDLRAKMGPSDLVQETFLRAQKNWGDFQGSSEDELLAWLRHILLNQVKDAHRDFNAQKRHLAREVIERPSGLLDSASSPSTQAMAAEQQTAIERAMAQLPDDYRRVIHLRNWERRSFKEIGDALGRSAEAVRKLWARAIEKLQQLLSERGPEK